MRTLQSLGDRDRENGFPRTRYYLDDSPVVRREPVVNALVLPRMQLNAAGKFPFFGQPEQFSTTICARLLDALGVRVFPMPKLHLKKLLQPQFFGGLQRPRRVF